MGWFLINEVFMSGRIMLLLMLLLTANAISVVIAIKVTMTDVWGLEHFDHYDKWTYALIKYFCNSWPGCLTLYLWENTLFSLIWKEKTLILLFEICLKTLLIAAPSIIPEYIHVWLKMLHVKSFIKDRSVTLVSK